MQKMLMKSLLLSVSATALLVGGTVVGASAAEYVSVSREGVNLRSGPGTGYQAIFKLPLHYPLRVLSSKGDWKKIQDYEKDKGWIHGSLVSSNNYVIVKKQECNVRSGPGTKNKKVGTVVKDVILKNEGSQGDWIKVSHPEINGWLHKSLVWP